ncbi:unnamed protein product [Phyllotreta striolata]|uniref:Phenoloxidase-activating factor 2 n=1 Tax=Phyllotreta striolata TaxID=444603 RepID=A0A9N9XKX1_PHYSR|nr:unnamed protein product [Phyllotreta striolata]
MLIAIAIACFLAACTPGYAQDPIDPIGADLQSLINQVFTPKPPAGTPEPPPSTSAPPDPPMPTTAQPVIESHGGGAEDCECVPYYQCKNGTIIKNGEGIIDIRINDGPCDTYIDICCKVSDRVIDPITPPPTKAPKGCGYRHSDGTGLRITGDKNGEAQFGEFPWMVALLREEEIEGNPIKLNVYQCGGALIGPRAVLTAAHCVAKKNKSFKVRIGEWDTQHEKEIYPYQDRDVVSMEIHPNYYAGALYNDVALLILNAPVEAAPHIGFVCLPEQGKLFDSGRGFATGWGKDQFGKKGTYQVILKKIELPVVRSDVCQDKLRTTRLGRFFELHQSFICAGGEPGKDTCKGDGGSPFVLPESPDSDRYVQAGIVAWGIGCGENGIPGVYVNVAMFRDWIDEKMRHHLLDTTTYQY